MTVLVVGATGLLGTATVEALERRGHRVVGASTSTDPTFDVFRDDPDRLVGRTDPDAVVVAATVELADVPRAEYDRAVEQFVTACRDRRLVYVSSDAVFDGERGGYAPDDPRSPRDEYGRRLVAFEDAVADHPDAAVLRPSYLYGGRPLDPRLSAAVEALDGGGTYERYDDVYRSPAHVDDVAAAVGSLAVGSAREVLHVPGPRLSVYEFHRRALSALAVPTAGLEPVPAPDGADVARDRSLVAERFGAVTGVDVAPPEATLDPR